MGTIIDIAKVVLKYYLNKSLSDEDNQEGEIFTTVIGFYERVPYKISVLYKSIKPKRHTL